MFCPNYKYFSWHFGIQQKHTKDFVVVAGADKNWYPTENALNLRLQIERNSKLVTYAVIHLN